jgi:hypothetical protein
VRPIAAAAAIAVLAELDPAVIAREATVHRHLVPAAVVPAAVHLLEAVHLLAVNPHPCRTAEFRSTP